MQEDLRPQLTLLFDVAPNVGLQRAGNRSDPDRFEREDQQFFDATRQAYVDIAAQEPRRVKVIDADATQDEVRKPIAEIFQAFFKDS